MSEAATTATTLTTGGTTATATTATTQTATAVTGGTAEGATGGAGGTTTAASTTETIDWLKGATELDVGYVKNKGWASPADVLAAYRGAEKFISAPVDQRLVIPGEKAEKAEWDAFYGKLGRPADAKDYKIPVPEGDKGEFAKTAAGWFHELGLSQKQAEGVAAKWNEHVGNLAATEATNRATTFSADEAKLKVEWGAAYDKNVMIAKEVVGKLGLDAGAIDKLQGALGHHGVMSLLTKIGSGLGEDSFTTGRDNGSAFGNAMTPAQAKAEIAALQNDKAFVSKYMAGDKDAKGKMTSLFNMAYPEQSAGMGL
jgi:hypothetical protein